MDAFLAAFIAALVTQIGDRNAWLTAILADRYRKPLTVAIGAGLAHSAGNLIAAAGGIIVAPSLTPRAQLALMALALFFAALGALWPLRQPKRFDHVRLGALVTSFCGVFALAVGDRTQFLTLAIAASAPLPWLAAAGAAMGAFAVAFVAAVLGESIWHGQAVRIWRIGSGSVLLLACAGTGLSAAGLA